MLSVFPLGGPLHSYTVLRQRWINGIPPAIQSARLGFTLPPNIPILNDIFMNSFSKSIKVGLKCQDAWELMWRPEGPLHFLGCQAHVVVKDKGLLILTDEAFDSRNAEIVKFKSPKSITIHLSWPNGHKSQAIVYINRQVNDDSRCNITVTESHIPNRYREEVERYWIRRFEHLDAYLNNLAKKVRKRRRHIRQAVVVIHGIGEQQPGEILNKLISEGILVKGDQLNQKIKPDYVTNSYEMRQATLGETKERPTTDVYEFYWAHIIRDTTPSQILSWIRSLLFRRLKSVPRRLRVHWIFAWLVILAAVGSAIASFAGLKFTGWLAIGSWALASTPILWKFFGKEMAINYIGDAARYLRPLPDNIAHRHAIRDGGVSLIEKLHATGKYDRIVMLGHSLGSVIAYDIITYSWIRMHTEHSSPSNPKFENTIAVERASLHKVKKVPNFQEIQHSAWCEQRNNSQPWLITDLITIGSPLTYANFLMVGRDCDFDHGKKNRILPTCPPVTDLKPRRGSSHHRMTYEIDYKYQVKKMVSSTVNEDSRTFVVFDHGAPFAVTRWTNLYFKSQYCGFKGDIIGGPLSHHFGHWVKDIEMPTPSRFLCFAHTWYLSRVKYKKSNNDHILELRKALQLNSRLELHNLQRKIPAIALLRKSDLQRDN